MIDNENIYFQLSEDLSIDSESYSWKKLDPNNEADQALVNKYWSAEDEIDGKRIADGKVFK